ncbi:MAG: hypothetical protein M1829_005614 [Trizodia sp. TS-e1964]|nr:MAG: hypothetical protein M1829_005614 [Trizodia sp. TS-e1964]
MSRGGRGGFRGGAWGLGKIGGADVPWAHDPELLLDYQPSQLFPHAPPPVPLSLSKTERVQVARYRSFRELVHEGPLYAVLGDGNHTGLQGHFTPISIDPFNAMPTYTKKYERKKRKTPKLDARPYGNTKCQIFCFFDSELIFFWTVLQYFPKELWSTLDPQHSSAIGAVKSKRKKLLISTSNHLDGLSDDDDYEGEGDLGKRTGNSGKGQSLLDILKKAEEDENLNGNEEEPEEEEEDVDETYEDDEEGGDYNAEQYFDDGGEDGGEDYDGGDDDGGGMY